MEWTKALDEAEGIDYGIRRVGVAVTDEQGLAIRADHHRRKRTPI